MSPPSIRGLVLAGACLPLAAAPAWAAGYALKEQSATAQGGAFAGATAAAEDISHMFFNPAGLTRHGGMRAQAVASVILPRSDPRSANGVDLGGNPLVGGDVDDAGADALVPALYASAAVNQRIVLGLGINAPFGLKTAYDHGWVGRYHGLSSELETLNVNPVVAYRVADWLSLGAGLQAQHADARLTQAIDTGSLAMLADGGTAALDSFGEVEGDDWGFGYTLGALFEPTPSTRIGVAYRSKVDHTLTGDAKFRLSPAGLAVRAATGTLVNTGAEARVTTPASASLGVYRELSDKIAVMGEFAWTDWSEFEELRIEFDNPLQPDSVTTEEWDDSLFVALGAKYRLDAAWTLRAGVAFDESPVPEATRTPRIPDGDRYWISIGGAYAPSDWLEIGAGYTDIFVEDTAVRLAGGGENAQRGSLNVDYENAIDIFVLSGRVRF